MKINLHNFFNYLLILSNKTKYTSENQTFSLPYGYHSWHPNQFHFTEKGEHGSRGYTLDLLVTWGSSSSVSSTSFPNIKVFNIFSIKLISSKFESVLVAIQYCAPLTYFYLTHHASHNFPLTFECLIVYWRDEDVWFHWINFNIHGKERFISIDLLAKFQQCNTVPEKSCGNTGASTDNSYNCWRTRPMFL